MNGERMHTSDLSYNLLSIYTMMERHSCSSLLRMIGVLLSERMYHAFPATFVQINNFNFYRMYSSFFSFIPK